MKLYQFFLHDGNPKKNITRGAGVTEEQGKRYININKDEYQEMFEAGSIRWWGLYEIDVNFDTQTSSCKLVEECIGKPLEVIKINEKAKKVVKKSKLNFNVPPLPPHWMEQAVDPTPVEEQHD